MTRKYATTIAYQNQSLAWNLDHGLHPHPSIHPQELKRAIRGDEPCGETGGTIAPLSGASTPKSPRTPAARLRRAKSDTWRKHDVFVFGLGNPGVARERYNEMYRRYMIYICLSSCK